MSCKAPTADAAVAMARIGSAADRPPSGYAAHGRGTESPPLLDGAQAVGVAIGDEDAEGERDDHSDTYSNHGVFATSAINITQ